jgi:clan AA aspartic protease
VIRGVVSARLEAVVWLRVRGPGGAVSGVEAVVDTGFSASLTLPAATVATLGLVRQSTGQAVMADASTRLFDVCAAEVAWGAEWRPVLVSVIGDAPLVGMRLLAGHELRMEVTPGGVAEIRPLP